MLVGIGLGPGNPDLLTLAAIKALKESRKVFVPGKLAAKLVAPYAKPYLLEFPMIQNKAELSKIWEKNAGMVAEEAKKGMVSFAVLGDPNVFSTFSHLRRTIKEKNPEIEITTIPGVSAVTAQAARTNTSIEGSFIVSDGSPVTTKIILKAKHPEKVKKTLIEEGFNEFIFAERLFMDNERITGEIPESGDYFSLMVARKRKEKINDKKIVYFVGAGPGNPKYITVKGRELLESADLVMYAGSLVNPDVLNYAHGEKLDSYGMKLDEIIDVLAKGVEAGKIVVRLHSGDPSLYGAIIEQIDGLKKRRIDIEIIPGVTSLFASAASLKTQLTINGITETLIITRPAGTTLEKDSLYELSRHNATMAVYLGTDKLRKIMNEVAYPGETPAAVVYHASWEDEKVILGTVGDIAEKIRNFTGGSIITYSKDAFTRAFEEYDSIIAVMAAGIAVRSIAPLIRDKWKDPAVVVVDSGLNFAIPILGGHHGGNELARKLAGMNITPVITTATEVKGRDSVEGIADALGCTIINKDTTKKVNIALLDTDVEVLQIKGPKIVLVDDDVSVLKRGGFIVGIGANRGVRKSEVIEAITGALSEVNAGIGDVRYFASAAIKENEGGIIDAAASLGKEIKFLPHELINSIKCPSESRAKQLGLNGVCEPAALALSDEKKLILKKRIYGNVTIAIAR